MADNVTANPGASGATFATDDIGGVHFPRSKVSWGPDGTANDADVATGKPLPVQLRKSDGTELVSGNAVKVDGSAVTQPVSDGSGSLTVDAPVATPVAARLSDGSAFLTTSSGRLAVDASGVAVPVTDNGGSLTVDGSVSVSGAVDTELTTADLDTGAGTDTRAVVGLVVGASGGAQLVSTSNPLPIGDNGGSITVDAASLPLPTGAATAAEQATQTTALQLIDDTVATVGAAVPAKGQAVAGSDGTDARLLKTDSSGELQVDVLTLPNVTIGAALPGGTNAIGKLAANSGVDIGDVDVTSVTPGTGATALGKATDSAAGATDTGVAVLAVRDDSLSTLTPVEGDYVPLRVNSTGALHVTGGGGGTEFAEDSAHSTGAQGSLPLAVRRDANTTLVDTDGDYAPLQVNADGSLKVAITAGAGSGGTSATDDAAFTVASGSGTPIMGLADETTPDSVDEGDVGVVRMTLTRGLHVNVRDDAGDSCMDGSNNAVRVNVVAGSAGGPSKVDDAAFTVATDSVAPMGALADDTTPDSVDEGDVGIPRMSLNRNLYSQVRDGLGNERGAAVTASNALKVDGSAVTQPVSAASLPLPTGASTLGEQQTQTTALQLLDDVVKTDDNPFTPATDKVAMIGAVLDNTTPDSVDEGDAGALRMSANRSLHTVLRDAAGNERGANVTAGNALVVDGSAVTQPVSAASLPLPTGAATAAEQATQTTALQLIDDAVATIASPVPTKGQAVAGTDGTNARLLKTDSSGELQVDVLTTVPAANRTASGALGALNAAVTMSAEGIATSHWEVDTGTLVGTVVFEATLDDSNWFAINALKIAGTIVSSITSFADRGALDCGGYSQVRLRVSAHTSGTSNARLEGSAAASVVRLGQALPAGTAKIGAVDLDSDATPASPVPAVAQFVAGTDGTNARGLKTDSSGELQVDVLSSALPTGAATLGEQQTQTTALQLIDDVVHSGDAAVGKYALIGAVLDDTSPGTVTENQANSLRMSSRRALLVEGVSGGTVIPVSDGGGALTVDGSVSLEPKTSGGLTISRTISAASTNATSVKASAGQVYGWFISSVNAAARYLKLYNKASSPTVGTDTPVMTILIPGNTAGAGANVEFTNGIAFGTGIALALTTGVGDADTGAVAANEIVVNLLYK